MPETKLLRTCSICDIPLEDGMYYAGVPSRCKNCHKTSVRISQIARQPEFLAYCSAYVKRVNGRCQKNYRKNNPHKIAAHRAVQLACVSGELERPDNCESCYQPAQHIEAHHDDYTKPLEVKWLCKTCHGRRHRELRESARYNLAPEHPLAGSSQSKLAA